MHRLLVLSAAAALAVIPVGQSAPVPKGIHPLFQRTDVKSQPPKELIDTYTAFVEQAQKDGEVEKFFLAGSIVFTADGTPESLLTQNTVSKAFLTKGFQPVVVSVRKVSDECYQLVTGTTAVWFIQTKSGEWKAYRYSNQLLAC